ncbi:MAG: hypothetical protein HOP19_22125 [Acidobacteria bacterium]|nr:hypothetical protein [Acidobacteriota bacterium]
MENSLTLVTAIGVTILLIVQVAVFVGFYLLAKRVVAVVERTAQLQTRAEYLLNNTDPVLKMAQGMMVELKSATGYLTQGIQHITAITEMARDEAAEVRGLLGDSTALAKREVERAKSQVDKVQNTITTASDQFERATLMVQNSVLEPAREFSYVMAGVRRAIEVMMAGRRLPVDRAYQDEEMFI